MNNDRRKQLAVALELLAQARSIIDTVLEGEEDAFEAMPESLQNGERGLKSQISIDRLEDAIGAMDDLESALNDAKE